MVVSQWQVFRRLARRAGARRDRPVEPPRGLRVRCVSAEVLTGSAKSGDVPDAHHEGHAGWRIDQISTEIVEWLSTYEPDLVLLHIGTNDIWQHKVANAPARLSALIDMILEHSSQTR